MLAKILKLYEIDATCYVLNTKLILMTKKLGYELNIGQKQGLQVISTKKEMSRFLLKTS